MLPPTGQSPSSPPSDSDASAEAAFQRAVQQAQQARSAADNTPPARHADQLPVEVEPGDTLGLLAEEHDESLAHVEANNAQISDPDLLRVGQIVFVHAPPPPSAQAVQAAQQARTAADGKPAAQHADQTPVTVAPGDTLSLIALQHNEPLSRLEANNAQISDPSAISAGQVVFVKAPPAHKPPPKSAPKAHPPTHAAPKPKSPPTPAGANILDKYSAQHGELAQWSALTAELPRSQQLAEEAALNRPIAAAQYLHDIAARAPDGKLNINHLPPGLHLTPDQLAVINYVKSTPVLKTALDVANKGGNADGVISTDDCNAFVSKAQGQLKSATDAFKGYVSAHPNGDVQSRELVRSASLLAANQSLLDPASLNGALGPSNSDGLVSGADLSTVAQSNRTQSALSTQLVSAASLWSNPGMLAKLDQAGDDLATTTPDGRYSSDNFNSWITKESPSTPDEFRQLITGAAARDLTANVSTKGLDYNVFAHPGRYTGAQKAAVLVQMSDLEVKLRAGKNDWDPFIANQDGIWGNTFLKNPTQNLAGQVQQKIDQLSKDPDVTKFLSQNLPGELHNLMQSDPAITAAGQVYYNNNIKNGAALNATLINAKASDIPDDLTNFEQAAGFYDASLGTTTNIRTVVDQNPNAQAILQISYVQQIVSGQALQTALDKKESLTQAIAQFNTENIAFAAALDPKFINKYATDARASFANVVQKALLTNVTKQQLKQAFGGPNGQFDPQKVERIIKQNQSVINAAGGSNVSTAQLVSLVQKMYNQAYKGAKLADLIDEEIHEPYGAALKTLFAAAALITPLATGQGSTSQTVSSALVLSGALTEAGAKALPESSVEASKGLALIGPAGKTIGGVGSGISGYFTLMSGIQDLNQGNTALGVDTVVEGAAGLVSGGAVVTEGVAGGLAAFGIIGDAAPIAAFAGPIGWAATGVGLLAASAIPIIEDTQQDNRNKAFLDQVGPVLSKYGFGLPPAKVG